MSRIPFIGWVVVFLLAPGSLAAEAKLDIRCAVPPDAYLAVYGQHNPERDFQRDYSQLVWQTLEEEHLPERILALVMDRLPGEKQQTIHSISDEVKEILKSIDASDVAKSPELVYGQLMEVPQSQHLIAIRLPSEKVATDLERALNDLCEMFEKRSSGAIEVTVHDADIIPIHTLSLRESKDFPFQPSFARIDDVLVLSTSARVVRSSVKSMLDGGTSKFDDPRLIAALKELPDPEDALIFYDGRQQFQKLRELAPFIRTQAGQNAKAVQIAAIMERAIDELAILDYEVTVEYTDGNRNLQTTRGQLLPDVEGKLLYRVCAQGKPFEHWQRWVPADASAYSLSTGVNLHALYEGVVEFALANFPEARSAIDTFEQRQTEWGIHLDKDILQAFSGECVTVALPATSSTTVGGQDKVIALRCHNWERIHELIDRLVEGLSQSPYAQSQQLKLVPCDDLAGFETLSANLLEALGARPVIGFRDGWMMVASNASAAKEVLRTRAGDAPSIDSTKEFQRFGLEVSGPVYAIRYTDLAASTRRAAQLIRQAAVAAPMIAGIAGAKAGPERIKPLQDALALLPAIANVVEKFDFLEARLNLVQEGDAAGSYVKRSAILIRPPSKESGGVGGDDQITSKPPTTAPELVQEFPLK